MSACMQEAVRAADGHKLYALLTQRGPGGLAAKRARSSSSETQEATRCKMPWTGYGVGPPKLERAGGLPDAR
eukprot:821371-Rhodomonas_salina.1